MNSQNSKSIYQFLLIMMLWTLLLGPGCSTDIFDPPREPVLDRLIASAYEVDPGDTVTVYVQVLEPNGDVLKYEWSANQGNLIQPTDLDTVRWVAPAQGGTTSIRVKVLNEHDKSAESSVSITIRSYTKPFVQIQSPKDGDFVIQNSDVDIRVHATHQNGISRLELWVAGVQVETRAGNHSNNTTFTHHITEPAGSVLISVLAVANTTQAVGSDSLTINVQGIILGKSHE